MRRLLHVMMLLAFLIPVAASAQLPLVNHEVATGVDTSRWYSFTESASTVLSGSYQDDGISGLQDMGMTFTFCGVPHTTFSANTNGNFSLGVSCAASPYGSPLSTSAGSNAPKIIGIGRDMGNGTNGYVRYEVFINDDGDSVFVCEFALAYNYGSSYNADVKWQIQLNQTTSVASIVYGPTPATMPSGFQIGAATSSSDVIIINPANHTYSFGSTSNTYSAWPGYGRYYEFVIPSCPMAGGLVASAVTSDAFTISWTENGSASTWEIVVSDSLVADFESANMEYAYSEPSYDIAGLNANTTYYVYVRPDCGGEYGNWAGPITVTTACSGFTSVPYTQDFEGLATGDVPNCWMQFATGSSSACSNFPCAYAYASNARNSQVYFEMESSSGQTEIIALPEMDNISSLELDFYYGTNSSLRPTLEVGVMEDTTFVVVDTVDITASTGITDYLPVRVLFGNYVGSGSRIALRTTKSGNYTLFIEDLEVIVAPTCNTNPGHVSVTAIDSVEATIFWGAALNGNTYAIYEATTNQWYSSVDTFYTFTGLNPNTLYSGLVYHVCSSGDTSYSSSFSFRTDCGAMVLPYTEDFESYTASTPTCWTVLQSSGSYPQINTGNAHSGNKKLDMYGSSSDNIIATPKIYEPLNTIETKFWARKSSSYSNLSIQVGYTTNLDSAVVYVSTINPSLDYTEYTISLDTISEQGYGYLVFKKVAGDYYDAYFDDITIRTIGSCADPDNFVVTGTATGEMSFAWTDSLAYAWQIAYGTPGFNPDNAENIEYFSDTYGTVTGLEDTLTYDFYLRADCGSEQSYWVGPINARPNLVIMTAGASDTISMCGGTITDDGGLNGNMASSTTSYMVIRPSDNNQTVALHGSVNMTGTYTYYTNTLYVYEGEGTSGRLIASYTGSDNNVSVASTVGAITLKTEVSYYECPGFQFNVSCLPLSSCIDPYGISVSEIAGSSAMVNWGYSGTTEPQAFAVEVTDTATGNVLSFSASGSARSFLISGLEQTTGYRVEVYSDCGSDTSNHFGTYFKTRCYVGGEVQVAEGTAGLNSHPICTYYNYSTFQMLYPADELVQLADTVYGIKFYANSISNSTRNMVFFLTTTSITSLSSGSSFVPQDSADIVWSGSITPVEGFNEIMFDTPFVRTNHNQGLLLTIDDNTGSSNGYTYWAGNNSINGRVLWQNSNSTNLDPTTSISLSTTNYFPTTWFMAPCGDASCVAPSVAFTTSTASSATINWAAGSSETAWTVEYKLASDTAWTVFANSTTNTSETITGLYANTLYDFRVGSLCAVSNGVPYGYTQGRTGCDLMSPSSLPYTDGFESYATGDVPNCWITPVTGSSSSGNFPSCYIHSPNAHNSNVYFEMEFSSSSATRYEIAALPAISNINLLMLDLYLGTTSSYCDRFEVGVWEDTVFVPVDTLSLGTGLTQYVHHTVYFNNYTGNGERIAFRASKASGGMTVFIDDIIVDVAPTCIAPTEFVSTGNTSSAVDLSWTNGTSATEWELAMGSANFTPVSGTIVTTNPYTVQNLTSGQDYYFYLRSICSAGDTSAWVGPVHAVPGTWVMNQGATDTITMCGGVIYDNGGEGNYANNSNDIVVIRPAGPSLAVNIFGSFTMENNYEHIYVYDGEGTSGTLLGSYTGSGSLDITSESGSLTLHFTSDASGQYAGFAFTVSCVSNTCPAPANLVAISAASTQISASWDAGSGTSWMVEYGVHGFALGSGTSVLANTNSVTINGLEAATAYDIYVTPICGTDDTGHFAFTSCRTSCFDGAINEFPWVEDFENGIDCWSQEYVNGTTDWFVGAGSGRSYGGISAARSGSSNAIFQHNGRNSTLLVTPVLNLSGSNPALLTFYHAQPAWGNDQDTLGVYYRNGLTDNEWHYLASWTGSITDWQLDSVWLPSTSSTYQIAFLGMGGYGYNVVIDSIVVYGVGSGCPRPVISNVSADYESVALSWAGNASNYEVAIKAATDLNWPAAIQTSNNSYTFTSLYPSTEYDVRVRAVCDSSESSWALSSITTDSLPCFVVEDLHVASSAVNGVTLAWTTNAQSSATAWVVHIFNNSTNIYDTVHTNPAFVDGLYDNTDYFASVQSMCSSVVASDWCDTITIHTATCEPVTGVAVSNVTGATAHVAWNGTASQYEINWGMEGFPQGSGSTATATSNSYDITGLEEYTSYDVYVRAMCAEGIVSVWSTKVTFETGRQGIDGVEGNYNLSIYPNPTSGNTTISLSGVEGMVTISIVDINGRTISSEQLNCGIDCEKRMEVSNLAQGTYFVRVLGDGINSVRKLIVR